MDPRRPVSAGGRGRWPRSACIALALAVAGPAGAATLTAAVEQAIASHPRVLRAQAEARAAVNDLRAARAGFLPSLDMTGGAGAEDVNVKQLTFSGANDRTLGRRESTLFGRQMLFDGFGTRSEVARRQALLDAAERGAADVRESIAFQAVQAWLDVALNRELVELARANVDAHRRTLEHVTVKVDSGVGQKADLQQARARLALAEGTLVARDGRLREVVQTYRRVVGEAPDTAATPAPVPASGLVVDGAIAEDVLARAIADGTAQAEESHPAMAQARAQVEAAQAAIKVARAAYWPRVDLEGNLGRNANLGGVDGIRNNNTIMVVGRWNLYSGGADEAAEGASIERREAALEALEDTRRTIAENVAIALESRATSESRIDLLARHEAASRETLAAYRAQFDIGRRTLLDLLNAENELFGARSNLVTGRYEDLLNAYFVEAAKGNLVRSLGAVTATEAAP